MNDMIRFLLYISTFLKWLPVQPIISPGPGSIAKFIWPWQWPKHSPISIISYFVSDLSSIEWIRQFPSSCSRVWIKNEFLEFWKFSIPSLNCHFWKIRKMINKINSWILTNSTYIWFLDFSTKIITVVRCIQISYI